MRGLVAFILGFILAAMVGSIMAHAQTTYVPHSQAQHDKYGGVRNKKGQICCNRNDCKQIVKEEDVRILPQGGYSVRPVKAGQGPEYVLEEKVADSPDGNWHICREYEYSAGGYTPTGPVRCLMIPQGGY